MRVVGLDVGEKRIGVAVSDPLGMTAQPFETIQRDEGVMERLGALFKELGAERLVVGLPLLMDGREGSQAGLVRQFVRKLEERFEIPVTVIDERLSTREASGVLKQGNLKGRERRGAADRVAAALILRAYLDGRPEE